MAWLDTRMTRSAGILGFCCIGALAAACGSNAAVSSGPSGISSGGSAAAAGSDGTGASAASANSGNGASGSGLNVPDGGDMDMTAQTKGDEGKACKTLDFTTPSSPTACAM